MTLAIVAVVAVTGAALGIGTWGVRVARTTSDHRADPMESLRSEVDFAEAAPATSRTLRTLSFGLTRMNCGRVCGNARTKRRNYVCQSSCGFGRAAG